MRSLGRIVVGFLVVASLTLAYRVGTVKAAAPVPADDSISPAVMFLIDVSGSMATCDAPKNGLAADSMSNDCGSPANTGRTRIRAAVLALREMLDANGDGAVNDTDFGVLKFRVGMLAYTGSGSDGSASLRIDAFWPIGTPYEQLYCGTDVSGNPDCNGYGSGSTKPGIEDLRPDSFTPTAEALATGVQNVLGPCYDGTSSNCFLNPRFPNNYWGNDDRAKMCRPLYVILLSDGIPNGGLNGTGDPVPVASALLNHNSTGAPYGNTSIFPNGVKTYSIGFGAQADMGIMNCIAMKGGTDANLDGDANPNSTDGNAGHNCSDTGTSYVSGGNYYNNEATPGLGNGYKATDAETLSGVLQAIANQINAGTYTLTRPAISVAGDSIYTAFFDVVAGRNGWRGHLRKFKNGTASDDSAYTGILNCDGTKPSGGNPANAIPCWDAGSLLDQNVSYGSATPSATSWTGRHVYAPIPQVANYTDKNWQQFKAEENWEVGGGTSPGNGTGDVHPQNGLATGDTGTPDSFMIDLTPVANAYTSTAGVAAISLGTGPNTLTGSAQQLALVSLNMERQDVNNFGSYTSQTMTSGWKDLIWAVGKPTATYGDGSPFCDTAPCTTASNTWKLQDSYAGDPVVVSAPSFAVDDPDFAAFQNGNSYGPTATKFAQTSQLCKSGVTPPCAIKDRATVVLIESNDGMIHAFDDATGLELWAIMPWHAMPKIHGARISHSFIMNSRIVVRDVKFDTAGDTYKGGDGDGHWHTVVFGTEQEGGDYTFGIDITDPVKPRWLWEWFDREEGLTFALPGLGKPCVNGQGAGCTDIADTWLFSGGGVQDNFGPPDTEVGNADKTMDFMTRITNPHDGKNHVGTFSGQDGLATGYTMDAVTGSNGLANLPGDIRLASSGKFAPLGAVDRGYQGDQEGRIWKWCDIGNGGKFKLHLFFDPAFWFFTPPVPNGYETDSPTPKGFMWDRAPTYFAPDVTMNPDLNHFEVVVGQGDISRPVADPASLNSAFLFTLSDRLDGKLSSDFATIAGCSGGVCTYVKDDPTCAAATGFMCQPTLVNVPGATVPSPLTRPNAPGMIFLDKMLTGPAVIFNNYVIYSEYRSHGAPGTDPALANVCLNDGNGRVKAYLLIGSPCDGTPGGTPFKDAAGNPTAQIDIPTASGIPSGPILDQNGNIYIGTSVVGAGDNTGGLKEIKTTLNTGISSGTRSWRQIN